MANLKYKEAAFTESHGIYGSLGIKIMIATDRELNENDESMLYQKCEEIEEAIQFERDKNDPKIQEEIRKEKEEILALFEQPIFVEKIPNGYDTSSSNSLFPWYIITTTKGRIRIGWRKRVINIDWSDSIIREDANDLFPKEETTKGDNYIHAWNYEKAKEYLNVLLSVKEKV